MLTVKEAIEMRRSIRKFKPDPVPKEMINQLLEAARLAPSASNRQPWRFQVITDPELKNRIFEEAVEGHQLQVKEAPVLIVCGSELFTFVKKHSLAPPDSDYLGANSEDWDAIKEFIPNAHMNTAIAIEHIVLMATALGLGTCWIQWIRPAQIARILEWPAHIVPLIILTVGYANQSPKPRPRRSLEEIQLGNQVK
jgi:nitroreductase